MPVSSTLLEEKIEVLVEVAIHKSRSMFSEGPYLKEIRWKVIPAALFWPLKRHAHHIHTGGYLTEREWGGRENSVCFLKTCTIWPLPWPYWCCYYSNWDPQVTHTLWAQISYLCVISSMGCSRFFVINKFHCFLFCAHVSFSKISTTSSLLIYSNTI